MILSSDQGTIVSVNGGETWSSWYNQPTAQLYHVITDNSYPYWIYGAQQDSGAIAVPSRSKYSSITERDWHGISVAGESGSIAPDPTDNNVLFGGTVSALLDRLFAGPGCLADAGQGRLVAQYLDASTASSRPLIRTSFTSATRCCSAARTAGSSWDVISPDLTREDSGVPSNLDPITAKFGVDSPRKGVIYSIAPSPLDANLLWVGTDDGLIHRIRR